MHATYPTKHVFQYKPHDACRATNANPPTRATTNNTPLHHRRKSSRSTPPREGPAPRRRAPHTIRRPRMPHPTGTNRDRLVRISAAPIRPEPPDTLGPHAMQVVVVRVGWEGGHGVRHFADTTPRVKKCRAFLELKNNLKYPLNRANHTRVSHCNHGQRAWALCS